MMSTAIVRFSRCVLDDEEVLARHGQLSELLSEQRLERDPFGWYASLHRWSVQSADQFWRLFWRFAGMLASRPPSHYVASPSPSPTSSAAAERLTDVRFFVGATLNHAENLLRCAATTPDKIALRFSSEDQRRCPARQLTYAQLQRCALSLGAWLASRSIGVGQCAAGVLPNAPEAVVCMLAAVSQGAAWACCSPELGARILEARIGQLAPTVLFVSAEYLYNGRVQNCRQALRALIRGVPSVQHVVLVPHLLQRDDTVDADEPIDGVAFMRDTLACSLHNSDDDDDELPATCTQLGRALDDHWLQPAGYRQVDAGQAVYVLFTSGTTGPPKCIVQGVGVLVNHLKEQLLHCDLRTDDTTFCYTSTSWMLWHWLVSTLAVGCTVQLYDGSPMYPDTAALWRLLARRGVTYAGLSARYLAACARDASDVPALPALRLVTSTGSPLQPAAATWLYRCVAGDALRLCSLGGGTEINGCLALGCPLLPTPASCELQCAPLGMDVDVLRDDGTPVRPGDGQQGELVCRNAFPSMPLRFANDDAGGGKYAAAYFQRYGAAVWWHGDYAERTAHGGFVIHGRSDSTLNPGGVRLGTAEYYDVVERVPGVGEALVVGQQTAAAAGGFDGDERVVLFVQLVGARQLDQQLTDDIRSAVRAQLSPKHVPAAVVQVAKIPVNQNMKKLEVLAKKAVNAQPITAAMLEQLQDPTALDEYIAFGKQTRPAHRL